MKWAKAHWVTILNVVLGFVNLVCLYFVLFPTMIQLDIWRGINVHDTHHRDALSAAVSLGRLDLVSVLLTVLGVIIGLGALFSFSYFKYGAEEVARDAAKAVASDVARETASEIVTNMRIEMRETQPDIQTMPDVEDIDLKDMTRESKKGGGNDDDGGGTV